MPPSAAKIYFVPCRAGSHSRHIAASAAYKRFPVGKTLKWAGFARPFESNHGVPAKSLDFVGGAPLDRAASFLAGQKGGKKPLRTCGSKNSLLPADLRPFITGAWLSKEQPYPPRALRPSAVRRLIFSLLMRSACRGGVGLTASVRNDRVPHHRRPPQQPLAQRKGRV